MDSIAKPLGSLGLLEEAVVRIAALTGSARALDSSCAAVSAPTTAWSPRA
ncbi:MAG: nicotinate-nucleotide--dimethylbenzimidazole phosphoribosyltransferase [Anaerotruncus massiliensis (ex Togo et al. 2019)]